MSLRGDLKEVSKELSAILAGFKLAVIIVSYIGIGSIAKWFVEHWYPFTRNLWDIFTNLINLPEFPIVVKDSLTALVFFLPLGITAIYQFIFPPSDLPSKYYRVISAILGLVIFYLVTKSVTDELISKLSVESDSLIFIAGVTSALVSIASLFSYLVANKLVVLKKLLPPWLLLLVGITIGFIVGFILFLLKLPDMASTGAQITSEPSFFESALALAFSILLVTVICIWLAVVFAPRKLLLATGASIAFISTAMLFEMLLMAIKLIETTSKAT